MLSNMPAFVFCSAFGNFVDLSKSFDNYQVMSSLPYSPPVLVKVAPSEKRNTPSSSLRVTMHHLSLFPCLALTCTHMSSIPTQKSSTWSELRVEWRRSSTSAVLGAARRPPTGEGGKKIKACHHPEGKCLWHLPHRQRRHQQQLGSSPSTIIIFFKTYIFNNKIKTSFRFHTAAITSQYLSLDQLVALGARF